MHAMKQAYERFANVHGEATLMTELSVKELSTKLAYSVELVKPKAKSEG